MQHARTKWKMHLLERGNLAGLHPGNSLWQAAHTHVPLYGELYFYHLSLVAHHSCSIWEETWQYAEHKIKKESEKWKWRRNSTFPVWRKDFGWERRQKLHHRQLHNIGRRFTLCQQLSTECQTLHTYHIHFQLQAFFATVTCCLLTLTDSVFFIIYVFMFVLCIFNFKFLIFL